MTSTLQSPYEHTLHPHLTSELKRLTNFQYPCTAATTLMVPVNVTMHARNMAAARQFGYIEDIISEVFSRTSTQIAEHLRDVDENAEWDVWITRLVQCLDWFNDAEVSTICPCCSSESSQECPEENTTRWVFN
jgi:hypothetical protein